MRVVNVYDIDNKTYLIRIARYVTNLVYDTIKPSSSGSQSMLPICDGRFPFNYLLITKCTWSSSQFWLVLFFKKKKKMVEYFQILAFISTKSQSISSSWTSIDMTYFKSALCVARRYFLILCCDTILTSVQKQELPFGNQFAASIQYKHLITCHCLPMLFLMSVYNTKQVKGRQHSERLIQNTCFICTTRNAKWLLLVTVLWIWYMCWLFGCLDLMRKLSSWWSQASDFTAQALIGPRIPLRQVSPWRFVRTVTALQKDSCVQVLNGSRIPLYQVSKWKLVWTMVALKKDSCEAMSNFSLFAIGCGLKQTNFSTHHWF